MVGSIKMHAGTKAYICKTVVKIYGRYLWDSLLSMFIMFIMFIMQDLPKLNPIQVLLKISDDSFNWLLL